MEKLQSALENARQKREAQASGTGKPTKTIPTRGKKQKPELWAALSPAVLDGQALIRQRIVSDSARPEARHFDILRTNILLKMRRMQWVRVAVTSPTPICGKTTTACNLTLGLGRQKDMSAILFDLDLRRPMVCKMLGLEVEHDISAMLSGKVDFSEQALRYGDNVAFSLARERTSDPSRLMLQQNLVDTLDRIERDYSPDVMLFDLPPVLVNDDARAFLKNVDCALIVARAEHSTAQEVSLCEKEVAAHTNVLGVVLNQSHISTTAQAYDVYY